MNKIKNMLIALIAIFALSTSAFAGSFGLGVSGSFAVVEADGTESDADGAADTSNRTATASNNTAIGEIFAEYIWENGFAIGASYVPGTANVNSKSLTRTDVDGLGETDSTKNGKNTAQAEVSQIITYYAEIPVHGGLYAKAGWTTMDVATKEKPFLVGSTTSSYGDTSVDGITIGAGYRNTFGTNAYYKIEGTHTDFDSLTLTSDAAVLANKITANLDVTKITFGLGYAF